MAITLKQLPPDEGVELMGLEKLGMSVFPGVDSGFEIPMIRGKYYVGQDDPKYKDLLKKFEDHFKVKFDSPEGQSFLENYIITINHDIKTYDPSNVEHQFELHVLRVNQGMGIVAVDDDTINETPLSTYRFIMQDENAEVERRVSRKETKLRAYKALSDMYDKSPNDLVTYAKYIFEASSGIGDNKVIAFDRLEEFINKTTPNAEEFLRVISMDKVYIETVVLVKEAIHRNIIRYGQDQQYVVFASGTKVGRNFEEVVSFFTNPANSDFLGTGAGKDAPYSLKRLLKK